ncbi:hypothetical protein [Kitasatospora sp. NBC_00315]|uniref:hypothetical protein n=1 Tax=Kitasatospora sp. NBC_00315 TaxID=2975963 RepID=UPI00324D53AF
MAERLESPPAGSGDPVRELMARHRELCERAVDALEIAAGLEEAGLGPGRTARYRHADVFALAEELYARVPRRPPEAARDRPAESWRRRSAGAARTALLAAPPCAALAAVRAARPGPPGAAVLVTAVLAGGWLAVCAAYAARPGGRPSGNRWPGGQGPAVLGQGLCTAALLLSPALRAPGPVQAALTVAAAVAIGTAEWAARWYRHVGRVHLRAAGTIAEFRARMRPVLPVAAALHLASLALLSFAALSVLTVLAPRPGPRPGGLLLDAVHRADGVQWAAQGALGLLFVLAALLLHCGRPRAALAGTAAGAGVTLLLRTPVWPGVHGPAGAQLVGCAVAGALLLPYAWAVLGQPGSHR